MKTKKLFEKYGSSITFTVTKTPTRSVSYKAFVQPLRYKNKLYLRGKYTILGKNKQDYYLYIGPPDIDISAVNGMDCHLYLGDDEYLVYRCERHSISDEDIYLWAIIRPIIPETQEYDDEEDEEIYG